jgi:hypothetical protein
MTTDVDRSDTDTGTYIFHLSFQFVWYLLPRKITCFTYRSKLGNILIQVAIGVSLRLKGFYHYRITQCCGSGPESVSIRIIFLNPDP